MVLIGDMLLGYGTANESLMGIGKELYAYLSLSDKRIILSAILGFIGIPLEGLCYFGVYRLLTERGRRRHAHAYRSGIFGYLAIEGNGGHVSCLACVFFYKYMMSTFPKTALEL